MAEYLVPWAVRAVKGGLSARAGLAAFRAGGGSVRDATWYRTVAEVRRNLADAADEVSRPLNRRPSGAEITGITTKTARGYIQQVDVYVRDRETGLVESRPFSWRTQVLITRKAAINEAIAVFQDGVTISPVFEGEEILGATYSSTLELIPGS